MLTPDFYTDYRVLPTPWLERPAASFYRLWLAATRTHFVAEGWDRMPATPCLIATNSTQNQDFMALRTLAYVRGTPCVTVTKAKNYHNAAMAFALRRLGVVPIASKGYFILADAMAVLGRRPTDAEYRALRDHVDREAPVAAGPLQAILTRQRKVFARDFDPAGEPWRLLVRRIYAESLAQTVRLAREAVASGCHVQMYPEGTVSPRLGTGRIGAVQLAIALGLPLLPVGMSGCPQAFWGTGPLTKGGTVRVRIGELLPVPANLVPAEFKPFDPDHETQFRPALQGLTDDLMTRINALLDPPFQRAEGQFFAGKGTRAHL